MAETLLSALEEWNVTTGTEGGILENHGYVRDEELTGPLWYQRADNRVFWYPEVKFPWLPSYGIGNTEYSSSKSNTTAELEGINQ